MATKGYGTGWTGERGAREYYVTEDGVQLKARFKTLDDAFAYIDLLKAGGRDSFPGFPHLRRTAVTDRGLATLLEVSRTSDNFLIGLAAFESGEIHSVFLGEAR